MASEWHYRKGDQQHGPVSPSILKNLAKTGNLLPTDLIWKEGMTEWKPARNLKGLFLAMPASTIESPIASNASPYVPVLPGVPETTNKQSLVEAAKGAAQYAAKQTERTKLINLRLPPLYQALGRHALSSPDFRAEFAELFQQLDQVQAEKTEIKGRIPVATKSYGDKAKAMAGQAMDAAQSQKLSLKHSSLLGTLGKAVYDEHETASGPPELVSPIADNMARLAVLDSELDALSATTNGSWITPKRLAISVGTAACVLLLFLMMAKSGSASYTQRVLDLTAEQKREFGVSVPKGARPLFAPGSTEDFIQSLTMFKVAGRIGSFNNHTILGDGSRAWGDSDSLNGIEQNCKVQFGGGIFMKTKCWDMIYGPQHSLATETETVSYGGTMSPGNMLVDRWSVTCTDETVLVRGQNRMVPGIQTKEDEILVMFVHFNEPYESIFPPQDRAGGVVHFDY